MTGFLPTLPDALDFLSQLHVHGQNIISSSAILLIYLAPALALVIKEFPSFNIMTYLQHNSQAVAASSACLFCALTLHNASLIIPHPSVDQLSCITLDVILYALTCLDHPNGTIQACGTSILIVLVDHGMSPTFLALLKLLLF